MTVPTFAMLVEFDNLAVPLARYAQLIEQKECAFWGVNNPDDPEPGCTTIWSKYQRDMVGRHLQEAQEEIETQVRFPMKQKWFANERQNYSCPLFVDWGRVTVAGIQAISNISLGEAVNHATDPAVVGPVATTVTNTDEIIVYHPGTSFTIEPSSITISGGNLTIQIPRCRMVKSDQAENPSEGWTYTDLTNFESTVDIKRVYNDDSTNATLVWPHKCNTACSTEGCTEYTQTACMYIRNAEIGSIDVVPANRSNGTWKVTTQLCCSGKPQIVRLNYQAGIDELTQQMEDAIVRLAHSKMPDEVCGCETWTRLWRRDRNVPSPITADRLNCPFGQNDGAWIAWKFTQTFRIIKGNVL